MFPSIVLQDAGYALEGVKQIFHLETGRAERTLTLLKIIDFFFNKNPYARSESKALHLLVDIFSCGCQSIVPDPQMRRAISGIARMAQLGISEFIRR